MALQDIGCNGTYGVPWRPEVDVCWAHQFIVREHYGQWWIFDRDRGVEHAGPYPSRRDAVWHGRRLRYLPPDYE